MSTQHPLTCEQLTKEYQWSQFPEAIQERLYRHYTTFDYAGNLRRATSDIQSVSDTLSQLLQGARPEPFLAEHRRYFGQASTDDLAGMAQQLAVLQQKPK